MAHSIHLCRRALNRPPIAASHPNDAITIVQPALSDASAIKEQKYANPAADTLMGVNFLAARFRLMDWRHQRKSSTREPC
jgi:hypothetical protein